MKIVKVKDKHEYDLKLKECRIKIGGKSGKFVPNINMSRWYDEAWLNMNASDTVVVDEVEEFDGDKLEIKVGSVNHKYSIGIEGFLNYEIIFEERPGQDKVEFKMDFTDGLNFWYQPPLTQQEIDGGCERPENVVGSYAVYWKKKNNQYKTGKFCHIYRPRLFDVDGNWKWIELKFENKKLTYIMDKDWLDNAAYPVYVR